MNKENQEVIITDYTPKRRPSKKNSKKENKKHPYKKRRKMKKKTLLIILIAVCLTGFYVYKEFSYDFNECLKFIALSHCVGKGLYYSSHSWKIKGMFFCKNTPGVGISLYEGLFSKEELQGCSEHFFENHLWNKIVNKSK